MKVYLNAITGIDDAIVSMFMSKRSWNREMEEHIREVCKKVLTADGCFNRDWQLSFGDAEALSEFEDWMTKLSKWGWRHITMLRFVDLSFTVEGLHRGGQDDWDAHAMRFNNRIIRNSTRLADFRDGEMSAWYQGKIIPTDTALKSLGIETPEELNVDGVKYVRTVNGYVREDLKDSRDAKRGLYHLSIPSSFIFKVNLTEFAHVYKERNATGGAAPEVKECCEACADSLEQFCPWFNRDLLMKIKN